jgi:hypothetical protein
MLIGDDVVVGEGHERSCHLTQPTVVSGGKAEPRALDIPQRTTLGVAGHDRWRVIASRGIIDDHDERRRVGLRQKRT